MVQVCNCLLFHRTHCWSSLSTYIFAHRFWWTLWTTVVRGKLNQPVLILLTPLSIVWFIPGRSWSFIVPCQQVTSVLMDLKHSHQPMVLQAICASLVNTALRGLQKELAALLVRFVKIVHLKFFLMNCTTAEIILSIYNFLCASQ